MNEYDEKVLNAFIREQGRLFPDPVAETLEEAEWFLEDCLAVVCANKKEVLEYFEDADMDVAGMSDEEILEMEEVFPVGDGRYLIVEG